MSCKVIHSLPLRMSAIHVIQDSKLVAVSHLIGLDQLPRLETAVTDYVMERVLCSEILSQYVQYCWYLDN